MVMSSLDLARNFTLVSTDNVLSFNFSPLLDKFQI